MLTVMLAIPLRSVRLWKSSANNYLCTIPHTTWCASGVGGKWKRKPEARLGFPIVTGYLKCYWNA